MAHGDETGPQELGPRSHLPSQPQSDQSDQSGQSGQSGQSDQSGQPSADAERPVVVSAPRSARAETATAPLRDTLAAPAPPPHAPLATTLLAPPVRATLPVAVAGEAPRADKPAPAKRFEERHELGRGGMGRVALAVDHMLAREVAVKRALSDDPAFLLRFAREMRITARLEHPSIVPVHDAGYDEQGRPYYVMRRIEGKPLEALVRAQPTAAERLALVPHVLAAAEAAAHAHARGILHRDIKPSNILIGDRGETLLIDWGLARELDGADEVAPSNRAAPGSPSDRAHGAALERDDPDRDSALTRAGEIIGTPGFVAPEQARGEAVGAEVDVYSLGATLAYVLTGRLVYPERAATGLFERAAADAPIELGEAAAKLPPALLAIVQKATAPRRADRYPTAAELADDLRRFSSGQLVAAHRYSPAERARRFARRHRAALTIGAAATAALAVTAALAITRVVDERDRAAGAERRALEQRALAEERSELLLLERARTLARAEPAAALATLKLLSPASTAWPRAWGIAAQAQAAGPSRGLHAHRDDVFALAASPDGRALASGGNDGALWLHDLATGRARALALESSRIAELRWLDADHLAYATEDALVTYQLSTGRERRAPTAATDLHPVGGGERLRYKSGDALLEIDRDLATTPRVLSPARNVLGAAMGSLVSTGSELVWLGADGSRRVLGPYREPFLIGAISPDGRRAAISDLAQVRLLELHQPGAATARWPLQKILSVAWGADGLCFSDQRRSYRATAEGQLSEPLEHQRQLRTALATAEGCLFVEQGGDAVLLGRHRMLAVPLAERQVRRAEAIGTGASFVLSLRGGGLELWPMEHLPTRLPLGTLPSGATALVAIGMSASAVYYYDYERLYELDRASGRSIALTDIRLGSQLVLDELGADKLVVVDTALGQLLVLDRRAARARADETPLAPPLLRRTGVASAVRVDDSARWLLLRGTQLSSLDAGVLRETSLRELPAPATAMAHGGGYVAIATAHAMYRVDLASGALETLAMDAVASFAIDDRGACWLAGPEGVVRWDGKHSRRLDAPTDVRLLLRHRTLGVLAQSRSGVVRAFAPDGELRQELDLPATAGLIPDQPYAVWLDDQRTRLTIADLVGGERIVWPVGRTPALTFLVGLAGDLAVIDLMGRMVVFLPPLPPHEPAALRAFLDRATNAEPSLETGGALRWRLPPLDPSP